MANKPTLPSLEDVLRNVNGAAKNDFPLIGPLENAFAAVGLMQPSWSPIARAAIGFGIGAGAMYGLNGLHMAPFSFDEYGHPRPFKLLQPNNAEATYLHWSIPAGFMAFVCGVLV